MIWIDSDGSFVIQGTSVAVPVDLQFPLGDGTVVTEGYQFCVVDADGTMRRE